MMEVWSPYSQSQLNANCGVFNAPWPQTVPIPNNNIIIVQDVPATQTLPLTGSCAVGAIGGFPQAGDVSERLREADCRYGNVYVEGDHFAGKLTISADNNIIITDDIKYNGGTNGQDVLGLIANNSVKLYHPTSCPAWKFDSKGNCTGTGGNSPANMPRPDGTLFVDPYIQAAILTLQHSFTVQYYQTGSKLGTIHLFGSFAQRYRGPVGQNGASGNGYLKDYVYDTRLRYAPPPYFLDPVHAAWGAKTFGEVAAKYQGQ